MNGNQDGLYFMTDEREHIRRVQRWLREISRTDERIPPIYIDGIYGSETRETVAAFQKAYGLNPSGELDKNTFDLIFETRQGIINRSQTNGFKPKFEEFTEQKMKPGDRFDDIFVLQLLLRELSIKDDRFFTDMTGLFDDSTESAVRLLQSILQSPESGSVDRELWNSLVAMTANLDGYT